MVDEGPDSYGVFICQSDGILSGVESYGPGGEAPKTLPEPQQLRPLPLGDLAWSVQAEAARGSDANSKQGWPQRRRPIGTCWPFLHLTGRIGGGNRLGAGC